MIWKTHCIGLLINRGSMYTEVCDMFLKSKRKSICHDENIYRMSHFLSSYKPTIVSADSLSDELAKKSESIGDM